MELGVEKPFSGGESKVDQAFYGGTAWLLASQLAIRAVNFVAGIVIARLLLPVDFGLMSLALTFSNLIMLGGNIGVAQFLIYRQGEDHDYLTAGFWLSVCASLGLFVLQVAAAPVVASFYKNTVVMPIMVVLGISFYLLAPLGSIHNALLQKRMHFRRLIVPQLTTTLVATLLTIVAASLGFGVWSLVLPGLIAFPVSAALSWRLCEWRPSFHLHTKLWGDMFRYGKNVLGNDLVAYVNNNVDYIIIGRLLGAYLLGIYTFAYNQSMFLPLLLIGVSSQVIFPIFSQLQQQPNQLQASYLKFARLSISLIIPLILLQAVVADEFIRVIYGNKWAGAVNPFRFLLIYALGRSLTIGAGELFNAVGRPDLGFKYSLAMAPILTSAVLAGTRWGVIGVAAATGIVFGSSAWVLLWLVFRVMEWRLSEFLRVTNHAWSMGLAVLVVSLVTRQAMAWLEVPAWMNLVATLVAGALVHLALLRFYFQTEIKEIVEQLTSLLHQLRS